MTSSAREIRLGRDRIKVLVGTDIVSRGIDVDGISHVINYGLPEDPESYVHRIGLTARAGATGVVLSFCNENEVMLLRSIEKLTKKNLTKVEDHRFHSSLIASFHKRFVKASTPIRPTKRRHKVQSLPDSMPDSVSGG